MQFEFANATSAMHQDVRRRVFASIETGNFDAARVVLEEYSAEWPEQAQVLRLDLIDSYGTTL